MNTPCKVNPTFTLFSSSTGKFSVEVSKVRETLLTTKAITLAFLFAALWFLPTVSVNAQNSTATQVSETPAKEGTFQFIFRTPGSEQTIALTPIQLIAIERLRKDNEAVYVTCSSNDYIKIKILPRSVVNSGKQMPKIIFKSEMEYEELQSIRYLEIP